MHILFLTDNFPPEVNAPATRTFEHCRLWVKAGHKVTVITGAPNFPTGRLHSGYRNRLIAREEMEGIEVVRVWTYITANEGIVKRTLDYASFMLSSVPASLGAAKVDIVVATSPQLFTACSGFLVGLLKRCPFVFELRDLWPESIRAVGAMRNSRVLDALESVELFLYRRAAHIVSVTHAFRYNLIERGIPGEKISVTTNGADLARFAPMPRDQDLLRRLGLEQKLIVGYVGTHGMAHALDTVLEAAGALRDRPEAQDIRFLFLGDGAEKKRLQASARERELTNVIFLDSVPRTEVARYWSIIDLAVIHLKKTPLFETVIPSKLFECMAMGLPVLHGVQGESADIVAREQCGVLFEPENSADLARNILRLAVDPEYRCKLSEQGRRASTTYDRTALATHLLSTLASVCGTTNSATELAVEGLTGGIQRSENP